MGRQKLTETQVRNIKRYLREGVLTHQQIADKINNSIKNNNYHNPNRDRKMIGRATVTKINVGMKNPEASNARWADIE